LFQTQSRSKAQTSGGHFHDTPVIIFSVVPMNGRIVRLSYKPAPKFKPRKRKPRTAWFQDPATRAELNALSISDAD